MTNSASDINDTDLMLLGELATYTSDLSVGLLDHNLFCHGLDDGGRDEGEGIAVQLV